jgi:magnesium transporter
VRELLRDIDSLLPHNSFLFEKVNFLMDAAQGFINIEQNQIIKIFSIAAVVFLPPTLVASIYGMNFDHLPELHWLAGYPWALALMVVSAIAPYWYFKRKGWL